MNAKDLQDIHQAMAAMEAQRAILGDEIVNTSLAALKEKLAALESTLTEQQRKQITVLFASLSGLSSLPVSLEDEEMLGMINQLWERVDGIIRQYHGHIDKHIGETVMALWGVEQSREDDPEQAVYAALAIREIVSTFAIPAGIDIRLHIGLHTGLALLGEVGLTHEFTAMGDTVNTASRLGHAAPPGEILISHATYHQVRGIFQVNEQAPLQVKGKTQALRTYQVEKARPHAFRSGRRGLEGIETRMVGRQAELERLAQIWQDTCSGAPSRLAAISGEAGVGKSRLLFEFENLLRAAPSNSPQPGLLFQGCSHEAHQDIPYSLLREVFANHFQIQENDPLDQVWAKIENGIQARLPGADSRAKAHYLGAWLGYDFSHSPQIAALGGDAEQLLNRGLLCLVQFFEAAAQEAPVLLLLEDIHWADAPSLDAIETLLQRLPESPLLVICLARPSLFERRPDWGARLPGTQRIDLQPLAEAAFDALVDELLKKAAHIPENLRQLIAGRAEGNPFYAEELVKMLVDEKAILTEGETWQVIPDRLDELSVPLTLTGVLQARLDRLLPQQKATLQRAAVVGRTFWEQAILQLESRFPADPQALPTLQRKEMIFRREISAFAGIQEYIFKHALLHQVTYESILKRERRIFHRQVGEWLARMTQENARQDEYAGLIGRHFHLGRDYEQARGWYKRAANWAAGRYANQEAVHWLSQALELTPETEALDQFTLRWQREKIYELLGEKDGRVQDLAALVSLAAGLGPEQQAEAALRQARYALHTADYAQTVEYASQALALAHQIDRLGIAAQARHTWATALDEQGSYAAACEQFQQSLELARSVGDQRSAIIALRLLARTLFHQGQDAEALATIGQALRLSQENGDEQGECRCYTTLGFIHLNRGSLSEAREYLERAVHMLHQMGDRGTEAVALANLGVVVSRLGDPAAGRAYLEQALRMARETNERTIESASLQSLGEVTIAQQDYTAALAYLEEALRVTQEINFRPRQGWALAILGGLHRRLGAYEKARAYCQAAMEITQELECPPDQIDPCIEQGLVYFELGQPLEAQRCYQQALEICREIDFQEGEAEALCRLGVVHTALGEFDAAENDLRCALDMQQKNGWRNAEIESRLGLASLLLARGNPSGAMQEMEAVLRAVNNTGAGLSALEDPGWAYMTCWRVLRTNSDPRAGQIAAMARAWLQAGAAGIEDDTLRRSFLEQIPWHREIQSLPA